MTTPHPGARLRALMSDHCVGLPGAFNGLVARAVAQAGFEGAYVSGAAVTAAFGVPDIGLLTLTEFCTVIRQVTLGSKLPVIADADTGFGEGEGLVRT
ncbi:MAG: isocitrate lyase/phosphoenolpyruvate mutase family protein, partial [Planctomycetota bacterium]